MKRNTAKGFLTGGAILALFVLYTLSLRFIDVQPIGPNGSAVAYATVNEAVHRVFGVHMPLYVITDWAGVAAILVAFGFGLLGLVQWIKRKHILRVDSGILAMGVFYILVFAAYVFFEFCVINYRPVLIHGVLEASYPSSTTMLAMCVFPTAMIQFRRLIRKRKIRNTVNILCGLFTGFMVVGRMICGVHWFTDILGGVLLSAALTALYWVGLKYLEG